MPTATSTSARTRAGTARARGSGRANEIQETARGTICPNHPEVPLQWLTEQNWFFRLSAYQERLEALLRGPPGLRPARVPPQRDARLHPGRPRGLLDQPGRRRLGHPVPDRRGRADRPARGRLVGPGGRPDLRLVRRPHQLRHRRRLSRRPGRVRQVVAGRPPRHRQGHRPVPHDLLAGHALVSAGSRRPATSGSTASFSTGAASG